jgi:hypothetical protein
MAWEMDAPENLDQEGNGLREAGKYHVVVLKVEENPTNKDGKLIDNAVFRGFFSVLDGTTAGQRDMQFDLIFFAPKMTHKDRGEMARKKIWFFASSIGCGEIANGKMVLDFDNAAGRQCCMDIEMQERKWKDDKGVEKVAHDPSLAYCNVYHVDDPRVKDWPKDGVALALLPPALRKNPGDFATSKKVEGNGKAEGSGKTEQKPPVADPQPKMPTAGDVNLDDL